MNKVSRTRFSRNSTSRRYIQYGLLGLWLLMFLAVPVGAQTSTLHFGSGLVFLAPVEEHASASDLTLLYPVEMSQSGRFVAGTVSYATDFYQKRVYYFYLWDLAGLEPDGEDSSPSPTQVLDLGTVPNKYYKPGAFIAISPDERYVALSLDTQLQILTLPELAIHRTITIATKPDYDYPRVFWSTDSRFVFFKDGTEFVILDNHTGETLRRYDLKKDYILQAFGDEWMLWPPIATSSELFVICSYWFEQCTSYEYPGGSPEYVLDPSRKTIAATRFQGEAISLLWTQQKDGKYAVEEGSIAPGNLDYIYRFSPSGRYLMLGINDGFQIWDLDTNTPKQTFPPGNPNIWLTDKRATWLTDDEFFVVWGYRGTPNSVTSEVWLYQLGQDIPLDTIELSSLLARENIVGDSETFGVGNVSDDGRWLIYGLGRGAVVFPIIYE